MASAPSASAPSPSLPPRRTEFFVLNAGHNVHSDVWMFGDMIAIIKEMRDNFSFTGTAWNLFPYNEYFDTVSKGKHKDEIWWGYKDKKYRAEPLLKYRKGDKTFWEDLDWESIPNLDKKIIQHIEQRNLNAGDRFNVFIIWHSQKERGIEVGNQVLSRSTLAKALSKMKPGVQVNLMASTCWSGKILNLMKKLGVRHQFVQTSANDQEPSYGLKKRVTSDPFCRGSAFLTAFLGTIPDWQHVDPAKKQTIGENINTVRKRDVERVQPKSIPEAYTNNALHVQMVEVMFDRYVPFKTMPAIASPQQFEELISPTYPAPLSSFGPSYDEATMPPSAARALNVIQKELDLVSARSLHPRDMALEGIMSIATNQEKSIAVRMDALKSLLQCLRWRFSMQERLLVLWDRLQERGFIDAESVMRRIHLTQSIPIVAAVEEAFFLFDYAHDLSDGAVIGPRASFPSDTVFGRFEEAITWLVVLILRTDAANVEGAIRFTQETGLLGGFDTTAEVELEDDDFEFKTDRYLMCAEDASDANERVGMILPHGEKLQRWATTTILRYSDLRRVYCEVFGEDSWPLFPQFTMLMKEIVNKPLRIFETVLQHKTENKSAQSGRMAVLR